MKVHGTNTFVLFLRVNKQEQDESIATKKKYVKNNMALLTIEYDDNSRYL